MSQHKRRKADHLALCATGDVGFRARGTLLDQVELVHNALPELSLAQVDTTSSLAGRPLRAPFLIAGMTGGVDEAEPLNRALATVAQELGLGLGLGSMRPLLEDGVRTGYFLRDVAPDVPLLGNLGAVQARVAGVTAVARLMEQTGCDALCLHLNVAQELVQPGGDTDFGGLLDTIARFVRELPIPVIVKETGSGVSVGVGRRLADVGVSWVDVGGAGGTSWVGVETLRERADAELGELFWDWGIPTAASVLQLSALPLHLIATGGVNNGLDAARALALGASVVGLARPFLLAWHDGGVNAVRARALSLERQLETAMLLTGSRTLADLRQSPRILGPALTAWGALSR